MYTRSKPIFKRTATTLAVVIAVAAALLSPASAQQGDTETYDVELVIFRHLASNATPEQWNLESEFGKDMEMSNDDASPFQSPAEALPNADTETFPRLSPSSYELTAIEEALRRSRNYRPIAHFGWTQPGYPIDAAPFLPINTFVPASSGLMGRIALSRGRYLHLTLDLTYTNPDSIEPSPRYVLRQSRRMRSEERHYIDHPEFGVIAVVRPSKK